jgi:hypothetical protein
MRLNMATEKTIEGATPAGGVKATIYYLNDERELVDEADATAAEIVEFDSAGEHIRRTYATLNRETK